MLSATDHRDAASASLRRPGVVALALGLGAAAATWPGCASDEGRCGPAHATVARVIDGDTVELDDGRRVRYLLVDTPESTGGKHDCYGSEAADFNRSLVEGKAIGLEYDEVCEDDYGRLLAYVTVAGREVNALLVERGFACVLQIPPNGEARVDEFESLEAAAQQGQTGLWGACAEVTCD